MQAYEASSAYKLLSEDPGQLCSIQSFNAECVTFFSIFTDFCPILSSPYRFAFIFIFTFWRNQDDKASENKRNPRPETEEEYNNEPKAKKQRVDKEEPLTEEPVPEEQTSTATAEAETDNKNESNIIKKRRQQSNLFKDEVHRENHNLSLQVMSK